MFSRTAVFVAGIALASSLVFAQGFTGTITGTVRDESGAVLQGALVTAKHTETSLTRSAVTDPSGGYSIPSLPVGAYEITAEEAGFKVEQLRGIDLVVAQEAVVNVTLQVGNVQQRVTITGEAPLVNTTLASTSGLITEQQVKDLPLNGRSFDQLLALNMGVVNNTSNMGGGGGFPAFSVAGKRQETNRFMINGVDWIGGNATGQFITPQGASSQLLGVEAVREYNVLEHTYGAEYGKRAGGQISIVTTSGTNRLHGDLFEFLRNSALDARGFFEPKIGPFKRNQFGGALGGPIKKDKLFLFGNYEGFRQRLAQSSRAIVPDAPSREGLLPCNLITPSPSPCPTSGYAPVPNLKQGILPFAKAFWPAPNGEEVLLANGLPSGTAYNYNSAVQAVYENFALVRFDYAISAKDSFSANYNISDGERDTPQADSLFVQYVPLRSQTLGLQETHVFSSRLVNSATAGWTRPVGGQVTTSPVPLPADLVFLPGGNAGSIVIGGGATTVAPAAVTPAPGNNPLIGVREYYTGADDLHFITGKHTFSAGVWVQRIHQNSFGAAQFSAGGVSYTTMLTFLQDIPSQFNLNRNPVPLGYRSFEAAWYLQDEIKLRRNLTVRLGLRDEMTNGWNEVAGRCSNYVFDRNFVISTNPVIGGSCLSQNNAKALWQPRAGIVWDPTGNGTWAVRIGGGIHNDLQDNLANRTYANPPYNAREQLDVSKGMLPLLPINKAAALPPTCGPAIPQPCSIYGGGVDPNLFTPTIQQWSFTVERELTKDLMLSVGYVGSQSYHTSLSINANTAPPQVCTDPQGCISGGTTTGGAPVPVSQRVRVPQGTTYQPPATRPNPYVGNGVQWFDQGSSSYHSLNVSLLKRATHGLTFKANYTYAKVMDLNSAILAPSAGNEPPDVFSPYNLFLNRGVASYSLNHQFTANFSYQLPFGGGQQFATGAGGVVNQLIGGWQWNGIVQAQGGFPFTPLAGSNTSGTGDANQSDTPDWNPDFKGPVILGKPDQWFDPRAFKLPLQGTFGNVSRGSLRGPKLFNVDVSLFKNIRVNERWRVQFRAEAFDIFNHPNFTFPSEIVFTGAAYSSSAGQITSTATPSRQIQFALKLLF